MDSEDDYPFSLQLERNTQTVYYLLYPVPNEAFDLAIHGPSHIIGNIVIHVSVYLPFRFQLRVLAKSTNCLFHLFEGNVKK